MWLSLYHEQWNLSATGYSLDTFITAHKRSLRRLCFHRCLSVEMRAQSLCVGGFGGCLCPRGSLSGGSLSGGSLSRWSQSRGSLSRGISVWGFLSRGLCLGVSVRETPRKETHPYGNVRSVRILLEFILVLFCGRCKFLWIREDLILVLSGTTDQVFDK